jgi:cation diffusion facilitator CzcD-associated flavoprotein CzcO
MSALPRACVIGAGSSGIAGAKALKQRGIPFDCFELSDRVGGNWVFRNSNGVSSAYRDLHINTSRERMEYTDFPMPKSYPDFPHHTQIAEYFDAYVEHFGIRDDIAFETGVEHAERRPDGVWEVTLSTGETRLYDAVVVANGHHWNPRMPEPSFPGSFDGEELHAHHYVEADAWKGKNVVVLGMGNSAMDIAVEASYVADNVYLAARRGAWIIPKYFAGVPLDQLGSRGEGVTKLFADPRLPWPLAQRLLQATFERAVGDDMTAYGLPQPDHKIGEAHPTISGRILDRITHGAVTPKPNIEELQGDRVKFADGSVVEADVIVYCTGYKVTFPFFDEGFISAPDNDLPLFRRLFHPDVGGVSFLGLLQPLGAIMPIAEAQGRVVAHHLRGEYHLPSRAAMLADMENERATMFKRYVASKRHTMQVDFDRYIYELGRELKRGMARAGKAGFAPQVQALAAAADATVAA